MIEADKIKERIKKLYALVSRGVGGERINAENRLNKLLAAHDIKLSDIIDTDNEINCLIPFTNVFERRLICQLVYKFRYPKSDLTYQRGKRVLFKATELEFAEIITHFSVYRKLLKEEMKDTFRALLYSQDIFPDKPDEDKPADQPEQTHEERQRLRKVLFQSELIGKKSVHKAISHTGD